MRNTALRTAKVHCKLPTSHRVYRNQLRSLRKVVKSREIKCKINLGISENYFRLFLYIYIYIRSLTFFLFPTFVDSIIHLAKTMSSPLSHSPTSPDAFYHPSGDPSLHAK